MNAAETPGGGAITAALYLSEFLEDKKKKDGDSSTAPLWFHVDFMGTKNNNAEPMGLRALYEYIVKEIVK